MELLRALNCIERKGALHMLVVALPELPCMLASMQGGGGWPYVALRRQAVLRLFLPLWQREAEQLLSMAQTQGPGSLLLRTCPRKRSSGSCRSPPRSICSRPSTSSRSVTRTALSLLCVHKMLAIASAHGDLNDLKSGWSLGQHGS